MWLCLCRKNATSIGRVRGQQDTSILWWTPWQSTTCLSTSCVSSRSQMPGWVLAAVMNGIFASNFCWLIYYLIKGMNTSKKHFFLSLKNGLRLQDGQSRTIRQFQFTDWPEQGVPKSGEGFIDFIGQVHKTKEQFGQDGPITVHCRSVSAHPSYLTIFKGEVVYMEIALHKLISCWIIWFS